MKRFLVASTITLLAVLLAVITFWYILSLSPEEITTRTSATNVAETLESANQASGTKSYELSNAQVERVESFGVDLENIEITPKMVACVEEKLGSKRAREVADGSQPTAFEMAKLLTCLAA